MPATAGDIRRKIEEIEIGIVTFRSFQSVDCVMSERHQEIGKNTMIVSGFFRISDRYPDIEDSAWFAYLSSDGSADLHHSACIRTDQRFTARDQKSG